MRKYFDQAVAEWKWIADPNKGPRVMVIWKKSEMHACVCFGELLASVEKNYVDEVDVNVVRGREILGTRAA